MEREREKKEERHREGKTTTKNVNDNAPAEVGTFSVVAQNSLAAAQSAVIFTHGCMLPVL